MNHSESPDVVFVSETRVKREPQQPSEVDRLRLLLYEKTLECDRLRVERDDWLLQLHTQIGILSGVRASLYRTIQPLSGEPSQQRSPKRGRCYSPHVM